MVYTKEWCGLYVYIHIKRTILFVYTLYIKVKARVKNKLSLGLTTHHNLKINAKLDVYAHAFLIWKLDRADR